MRMPMVTRKNNVDKRTIRIEPITEFLAVDLEIVSRSNLDRLIQALGMQDGVNRNEQVNQDHIVLLGLGMEAPSYEAEPYINFIIQAAAALVEKLPKAARRLWDQAQTKTFDIGIQAGKQPRTFEVHIDTSTITALGRVGSGIQITIYGAQYGANT